MSETRSKTLLEEARLAVRGVFKLLTFRKDWRSYFDISERGVARSFAGIGLALPAFVFLVISANHFVIENPALVGPEASFSRTEAAVVWARFWLLFPIVAAGLCMLLDRRGAFGPWLVVHNWTVFVLIHVQALFWAFYMAGLADPRALASVLGVYQLAWLLVHWRVAHGALGLPPGLSAAAAGVALAADRIVANLI